MAEFNKDFFENSINPVPEFLINNPHLTLIPASHDQIQGSDPQCTSKNFKRKGSISLFRIPAKLPTLTKSQSVNKHINDYQQLTPSKRSVATDTQPTSKISGASVVTQSTASTSRVSDIQLPSVNQQLLSPSQDGKPKIVCHSSLKKVNKCSNVLSNEDVCISRQESSKLKGVTITTVDTSGTKFTDSDSNLDEEIPICAIEPVIMKVETREELARHIDKLNLNPKLLDDTLWENDLDAKSCLKVDHSFDLFIGNFTPDIVSSSSIVFSIHGIRMNVLNCISQPVTIDIQTDNIVNIFGYFGSPRPFLFIYTNYLAAFGIQLLLKMCEKNRNCLFDPISKNDRHTKIMFTADLNKIETSQLEKLLLKLPNGKYKPLTRKQASIILRKSLDKNKNLTDETKELTLLNGAIDGRLGTAVKISDYKTLTVGQYLNDVIIEYYLNYSYCRKLSVEDRNRTFLLSSFFYVSISSKVDRPNSFTKKVNIFEKDFIVIPICEKLHWLLAIICYPYLSGPVYMNTETPVPKEEWNHLDQSSPSNCETENIDIENYFHGEDPKNFEKYSDQNIDVSNYEILKNSMMNSRRIKQPCILIFDSLHGGVHRALIVANLRRWLIKEYDRIYPGREKDFSPNVMKGAIINVPQQTNLSDCGLFILHYFDKFFECPIVDFRFPIEHLTNWFHVNDVSLNSQKRKEVKQIIIKMMEEQGVILPPRFTLPQLKFV